MTTDSVSPELLSEIVREYDAEGWHRTGTETDAASGRWLIDRVQSLEVLGDLLDYPFERIDPTPNTVSAGDFLVEGYPALDSVLPGPNTVINAPLSFDDEPGTIRLLRIDQHANEHELDAARKGQNLAIIAVIEGDADGFTLINAWKYRNPEGLPVAQMPIRAWTDLEQLARSRSIVSLSIGASRTPVTIHNVKTKVEGTNPALEPLVVLTPRSGWWQCAGERGGGLAVWLELLRLIAREPLQRDVHFLATTGHELNYLGAHLFLEADATLARQSAYWLHLGANVGASDSRLVVRATDEGLLERAKGKFEAASVHAYQVVPNPPGEAGVVKKFGGQFVSLIGAGFPYFHSTSDRWPVACDFEAMARIGDAALALLRAAD